MSTLGASLALYTNGYPDEAGRSDDLVSAATLTGLLLAARYAMDAFAAAWLGGLTDRVGIGRSARGFFLLGGAALLAAALAPSLILFGLLVLVFFVCGTGLQAGLAGSASPKLSG